MLLTFHLRVADELISPPPSRTGVDYEMICPHCNHTIREEERYLMSRDPDAQWPAWGKYGLYLLLFVFLVGVFALHASV